MVAMKIKTKFKCAQILMFLEEKCDGSRKARDVHMSNLNVSTLQKQRQAQEPYIQRL